MNGVSIATPRPSLAVRAVRWYQEAMVGRPSPCRFTPSCSSYAHEALVVHGTRRGLWLTVRRLLRCRPFGPSGFDPVPLPDDHQRGVRAPRRAPRQQSEPARRPAWPGNATKREIRR